MAANSYYQSGYSSNPPTYEQVNPQLAQYPATGHPGFDTHPYQPTTSDPQLHYSQQSLGSDQGAYAAGARLNEGEQYAENIPLKANNQYPNGHPPPANWMQQQTHYPPSPDEIEPAMRPGARRTQKKGFFGRKIAWVTYTLTLIQIIVFIVELVKNAQLTGSPIETKPSFNVMIGPSPYLQIYMGSRYTPCMKNTPGIQNANETILFPCPNATTTESHCTLSELCGFNGVPNPTPNGSLDDQPEPNQWFRFIIPMFIHSGFIHIGFNLLAQMTIGVAMEKMIGWWRYALVYLASGIWGFVLGGNYAAQGQASCGCSGALFGILALDLLDLLYSWQDRQSPWVELIIMVLGIGVSFVLGLLPGLDNFSHIGGFTMGLALGLCLLRSPNVLRERIGLARNPYVAMSGGVGTTTPEEGQKVVPAPSIVDFLKGKRSLKSSDGKSNPMNFFRGRKPLWWAWWLVRVGALVAVLVGFILLIIDFYKYPKSNCSWCYRLSCLPIKDWCEQGNITTEENST
ncbi:rhomboid family membrane protein [Aspergillus brunneoviolaceus CBS 621.78]|uniref:DHHC zinc finger membrane protein n=1 Tax=Aspergillus brunneoviolaceus CBS 621.78 TaxID=1450534 RepID=A0ACD1GKU6_9EURO|nr:DHHC zinc finger membrane protein [Aspergillus brunneoviolaceus CBS 621.78]RAH49872.1 DHHC zinc finger membrane protein [Aspergillus brunneoviolaceus CBS 621.78]